MDRQIAHQAGPGSKRMSRRGIGKAALGAAAGLTLPVVFPVWSEARRKKRKRKKKKR